MNGKVSITHKQQLTLLLPLLLLPLLLDPGVLFNEVLLLAVVSPAAFEPRPLDDVIDVELLSGDRAMADNDFCFGGVFIGGVSSQLVPQLSSRDTLVSCGLCDALSSYYDIT